LRGKCLFDLKKQATQFDPWQEVDEEAFCDIHGNMHPTVDWALGALILLDLSELASLLTP
jgi:hypothetical protein